MEQAFLASGGEWKEFLIGELFEKLDLKFKKKKFNKQEDISKEKTAEFDLPLVNAKNGDNGIMYYGRSSDFESAEMTIDIVNDGAVSTGNVYPQPQKTGVLYNAYLIKFKGENRKKLLPFFSTAIQKSIKLKFGYENKAGWEKVKKEGIQLPTLNNEIALDFMENFVSELQNYLKVTGLSDYTLTAEEKRAVEELDRVEWGNFNIVDIFNVKNTHSILSSWITPNSGKYPYVTAGESNNSISTYIDYDLSQIEKGNSIMIGGKTLIITYQEQNYFSNDSHNLALYIKDEKGLNKDCQLFMVATLFKSLKPLYSWGNSISKKKIQNDVVDLPVKNDEIDFDYMETLVKAVQKLVIADVVKYADREMAAYERVIG
ncbi:restriction endonuclease subunit S [Ursidibacter arcticus]